MKKPVLVFLFVAALSGCSEIYFDVKPAKFMEFEQEVSRIMEEAPCEWTHGKADPQSVIQYDFGCHGGKWGNVSLYVDRKKNADESVRSMRLLWKEKEPEYYIGDNDKQIAEEFIAFLSRAYAPDFKLLKTVFMGTKQSNFSTSHLNFDYTYTQSKMYGLHRLEIVQENPTIF